MSTPSARTGGSLDAWFKISQRGSTVRQEVVAGLTTFLAMVYSVIVVPGMLGKAGFPPAAVFVATCLVCEGDAAAGVYAMDGAITRAGVNARAIKLQAVAIIAGSAIKLPTENAGEGLLRDITQVHCDIKNRTLGGAQLNGGQ